MKVTILQGGRVLREHRHQNELYVEAPPTGDYVVRLTNDYHARRMAVLSVDGINAINGADAGFDGPGYVLDPWASVDVPGWHRDGKEVAAFSFREQGDSYAAQTSRGTRNVGVIGVAVFDEKVRVAVPPTIIHEEHHHHHHDWPWWRPRPHWQKPSCGGSGVLRARATLSASLESSAAPRSPMENHVYGSSVQNSVALNSGSATESVVDVGTAYGQLTTFHTVNVSFERASTKPTLVIDLRYATRERLKTWGVPVDAPAQTRPQAFPLSQGCPPPPNWRG